MHPLLRINLRLCLALGLGLGWLALPAWMGRTAAAKSLAAVAAPPASATPAAPHGAPTPTASSAPPPTAALILQESLAAGLRFNHLSLEDGLSHNTITALLQDRQGFIWIGAQDGLNRFDGYTFKVYKHDPNTPASLSHSSILSLYQDRQGFIWVGTDGGGLNRLDPRTDSIVRYRHTPSDPYSLANDTVSAILEDRAGRLWVGTMGGGLDLLDRAAGRFTHFAPTPNDASPLHSAYISTIYEDTQNMLWLGAGGIGNHGAGLIHFDPRTGKVIDRYRHTADPASLSSDTVSAIVQDRAGWLWIGTGGFNQRGAGLNRLNLSTGKITRYTHQPGDPNSLADNDIMSLTRDATGWLWVGTWGGGLEHFDPLAPQPRFLHTRHDPYEPRSLSGDNVWPVLQDRSGMLWIGTIHSGVNLLNPQVQQFELYRHHPDNPNSLGFDIVGSFYEDPRGGIWVSTLGGGLDYWDTRRNTFTHYRHDPNDPTSLPDDTVGGVLRASDGALWVGAPGGLARLDEGRGRFTLFAHHNHAPPSLLQERAPSLLEDPQGRLWIATPGGLEVFDPRSQLFTPVRLVDGAQVINLTGDSQGRIWAGTLGLGAFIIAPETLNGGTVAFEHIQPAPNRPDSLSGESVWTIYETAQGDMWFGVSQGLDRRDPQGRFTHYSAPDGLPNNPILCILEDPTGSLWVSANNGMGRFNPQSGEFRTFDVNDGLQNGAFNANACLKSRSGKFYFGGMHGFNVFDPQVIQENTVPPPLALTAFRVFNQLQPLDPTGESSIYLSYQQNQIAFEFTALDFHTPSKNRFAYKLEGVDADWVQAGDRRYAAYTNLDGGEYVFRVRAANNSGVWNEAGLAQRVVVAPRVWQTVWFRLLLLFGGVMSFALAGWLRVQAVHNQNRRLEALVAQNTSELRESNQRLREEIAQRQKAEETLLARTAEEAVAHERTRLARDLHDAVTQTLFSASLIAEVLPQLWAANKQKAAESTEELRQLTRGALAEMRTLLLELRPAALTQTRFEDLIKQLSEALIGRARLPIELRVTGRRDLPPEVQVALYRIAQESLNNVAKYAKATHVVVDVQMGAGGVRLCIQDDGVGFDPQRVRPDSLGQRIMHERAENIGAELTLTSTPGEGTQMIVVWTPEVTGE